ncbi:MAG TPA: hypothetical protein VLT45_05945, partial [Kofleriaceae bacterium]|nr:hypothetical protein [Kofleriaceae bacterium]
MITLAVIGATPDALAPLCRELTKLVGDEVTSTHPATYAELASAFEKDRVQYAWMSPSLLVLTDENTRLTPLLS